MRNGRPTHLDKDALLRRLRPADIRRIFEELGFRFNGHTPNGDGWVSKVRGPDALGEGRKANFSVNLEHGGVRDFGSSGYSNDLFGVVQDVLGCSFQEALAWLADQIGYRPTGGLTLETLAHAKGFSPTFLEALGVAELKSGLLEIRYRDLDGSTDVRQRLRTALAASQGSMWRKGAEPIVPYGLWRKAEMLEQSPSLLLVEGETCAWTAWKHDRPALGIPGKSMHGTLRLEHIDGFERVLVGIETKGGRDFAENMRGRLRQIGYQGGVFALPFPDDDLNALYLDDPGRFLEQLDTLCEDAPPLTAWLDARAPAPSPGASQPAPASRREPPFSLDRLRDDIAGADDPEEVALDAIEQAAPLPPVLLLRAEKIVRDRTTVRFAQQWMSAVKQTASSLAGDDEPDEVSIAQLAALICAEEWFAKDRGRRLYRYAHGVYRPDGAAHVRRQLKRVLRANNLIDTWGQRLQSNVVEFITVDAPEIAEAWPAGTINLRNGLLDVASRTLRRHTPELLTTLQLPIDYDPDAQCPRLRRFAGEVLPPDSAHLLPELIALCAMEGNAADQSVMCLGAGSNGKSTLLDVVKAALGGPANVSAVDLQAIGTNRFAAADLYQKLANIAADISSDDVGGTGPFKALTSGDLIRAERKYEHAFTFHNRAVLLFSANEAPHCQDATPAFFRRWVVVPFTRTFQPGDDAFVRRSVLVERLTTDAELSGLLNWALDRWEQVAERGLTVSSAMRRAWHAFRRSSDPLGTWLHGHVVLDPSLPPNASIPCAELLAAYNRFARDHDLARLNATSLGRSLKDYFPEVERKRATGEVLVDGEAKLRPRVYQGLRWRK